MVLERIVIENGFVQERQSGGGENVIKAAGQGWKVGVKVGRKASAWVILRL